MSARYDQKYFDKWYRHPRHRVSTMTTARRKASMALSVAEYFLERPVRTVLDVGCGEGQWQPILSRLRPGIRYLGVDPSEYAVDRFGKKRNLVQAGFGDLGWLDLAPAYDLIVCSDILYYVDAPDLEKGLEVLATHLGGVAFLEAYASDEALKGDCRTMERRDVNFYRRLFRRHGLVSCGPHCYAGREMEGRVTALERGGISPAVAPRGGRIS